MTKPPAELRRSGSGVTDDDSAQGKLGGPTAERGHARPRPGEQSPWPPPRKEQDKPELAL